MRLSSLSRRDRRALVAGGLVLAPALLYAAVVRPYLGAVAELRDRIAVEQDLLERERGLLAAADRLGGPAAAQRQDKEQLWQRLFLDEGSGAAISLEEYLVDLATQSGVYIEQSDSRLVASAGQVLPVLRADARGISDFEGILELLYSLENGEKAVRVESVSLEPLASVAGEEERIALTLSLAGHTEPILVDPPDGDALNEGGI